MLSHRATERRARRLGSAVVALAVVIGGAAIYAGTRSEHSARSGPATAPCTAAELDETATVFGGLGLTTHSGQVTDRSYDLDVQVTNSGTRACLLQGTPSFVVLSAHGSVLNLTYARDVPAPPPEFAGGPLAPGAPGSVQLYWHGPYCGALPGPYAFRVSAPDGRTTLLLHPLGQMPDSPGCVSYGRASPRLDAQSWVVSGPRA